LARSSSPSADGRLALERRMGWGMGWHELAATSRLAGPFIFAQVPALCLILHRVREVSSVARRGDIPAEEG